MKIPDKVDPFFIQIADQFHGDAPADIAEEIQTRVYISHYTECKEPDTSEVQVLGPGKVRSIRTFTYEVSSRNTKSGAPYQIHYQEIGIWKPDENGEPMDLISEKLTFD
tara:strand:+ start:186 stop:512 length:327 start_codon:yes stop_codon:yes gene_type:complete